MSGLAARLIPTFQLDVNLTFYLDAGSCGTRDCRGNSSDWTLGGIDRGHYVNATAGPQTVFIVVDTPQRFPMGSFTLDTATYPASSAGDRCSSPIPLPNPSSTTQNLWLATDTLSTLSGYCVFTQGPNRFYIVQLPPRTETLIRALPHDTYSLAVSLIADVSLCGTNTCLINNSMQQGTATTQNTTMTTQSVIVGIEAPYLLPESIPVFQLDISNTPLP